MVYDDKDETEKITKEHRNLAKNSFYSILNTYGTFLFTLIITFFIARLISKEAWGYLILANSYILIITIILTFLPPGLNQTLNYFIPRYYSLNQISRLKSLIKYSLILKIIFLIPVFFISFLLFIFLSELFALNLTEENLNLLFLLSPLIIINSLEIVFNAINQGFNKYNLLFILLIIKYLIYIGFLAYFFFFLQAISLETLVITNVISSSISFILNFLIILNIYTKIKSDKEISKFSKEDLQRIMKYGIPVRTGTFLTEIWVEIQTQAISIFETSDQITGFNTSRIYLSISVNILASLSSPLTISFSRIIAKNGKNQIESLYNLFVKYSLFMYLLITGILFYIVDFFIVVILGETYLVYSELIKIYLFSYLFLIFASPFDALMLAENRAKYIAKIRFYGLLVRAPLFFILLIKFGMIPAFYGILISNFLYGMGYLLFTLKIGKIKLNLKNLLIQYIVFLVSLGISLILHNLFIYEWNYLILQYLNLLFFQHSNLLSLIIFVLIFIFLNVIFKVLTTKDIENLQIFFNKEKKIHRFGNKVLNLLKRIFRD